MIALEVQFPLIQAVTSATNPFSNILTVIFRMELKKRPKTSKIYPANKKKMLRRRLETTCSYSIKRKEQKKGNYKRKWCNGKKLLVPLPLQGASSVAPIKHPHLK